MLVSEMWYRWGWLICIMKAVLLLLIWTQSVELRKLRALTKAQQELIEILPKKCLTYHQLTYFSAKYDLYMDSLNYASKKDRSRLADSTRKFGQILRQNDNP